MFYLCSMQFDNCRKWHMHILQTCILSFFFFTDKILVLLVKEVQTHNFFPFLFLVTVQWRVFFFRTIILKLGYFFISLYASGLIWYILYQPWLIFSIIESSFCQKKKKEREIICIIYVCALRLCTWWETRRLGERIK